MCWVISPHSQGHTYSTKKHSKKYSRILILSHTNHNACFLWAGAFDPRGRTTDRRLIYGHGERRLRRESKDGADKYLLMRNGDFFLPLVISSHCLSLMLSIRLHVAHPSRNHKFRRHRHLLRASVASHKFTLSTQNTSLVPWPRVIGGNYA